MPDHPSSVHPPPFDYHDPVYRTAAREAKARSAGRCQRCGRQCPLEAHHYRRPYPPPGQTTPADVTALCRDCHDDAHDFRLLLDVGIPPGVYRRACSELVQDLVRPADDGRRAGRVVSINDHRGARGWGAIIGGASRPGVGESFWLFLRGKRTWRLVAVTAVLGGRPGHWRVRKRFLDDASLTVAA